MDGLGLLVLVLAMVLLGLAAGLVTGLSPGLHVNNVAALVVSTQAAWSLVLASLPVSPDADAVPLLLAVFIVSTGASHAVFDFVPSVFFGAPSEETALGVLPGHRMLLRGEGAQAVALAARGALLGSLGSLVLLVPLRLALADPIGLFEAFRPWAPAFLVALLALLLASEAHGRGRMRRVLLAAWVQALAGALGVAALRGPSGLPADGALFPLFAGLFGLPGLIRSARDPPSEVPPQREGPVRVARPGSTVVRGVLAGAAVSWLPGLSGGAAAALASLTSRRTSDPRPFMLLLGATSSSTAILSVGVLFMIGRARSGVAAGVASLFGDIGRWPLSAGIPGPVLVLSAAAVLSSALAAPLASWVARWIARGWSQADPRRAARVVLAALVLLLALLAGPAGLALAGAAALVGSVPPAAGVKRVHLMASLLVPVLLTYIG